MMKRTLKRVSPLTLKQPVNVVIQNYKWAGWTSRGKTGWWDEGDHEQRFYLGISKIGIISNASSALWEMM